MTSITQQKKLQVTRHGRIQNILTTHGYEKYRLVFQHGFVCFHGKSKKESNLKVANMV